MIGFPKGGVEGGGGGGGGGGVWGGGGGGGGRSVYHGFEPPCEKSRTVSSIEGNEKLRIFETRSNVEDTVPFEPRL